MADRSPQRTTGVDLDGGARLRTLRERLDFSQRDMAREFQVSSGAIAHWETGFRPIPGPVLRLIGLYEEELSSGASPFEMPTQQDIPVSRVQRAAQGSAAGLMWFASRLFFNDGAHGGGAISRRLRRRAVEQFVETSTRLKGISLKWAQLAWNVDLLLAPDEQDALQGLRLVAPALSAPQAAEVFLDELGVPPRQAFAQWSPRPFASASIGQVHEARLVGGQRVAVKIQYPRLAAAMESDLANLKMLDGASRILLREQAPGVIYDELRERFREELDYEHEARQQRWFSEAFKDVPEVLIPEVFAEWSRRRVLTTALVEGETLEAFAAHATQEQRDRAGDVIWKFYYRSCLELGIFNTDPNPGNLLFLPDRVAFLDFGRVKRFSPEYPILWNGLARAVLERNERAVREALMELRYVPNPQRFDFAPVTKYLLMWCRPCLTEGRFAFTPDYLRSLWASFADDPTRRQVSYSSDMIFLNQLLFGVGNILAKLGARVACREIFLPLVYRPGEKRPEPYTAEELKAFGV